MPPSFSYQLLASTLIFFLSITNVAHSMSKVEDYRTTLRVMSTSDVHGQMLNYDYFSGEEVEEQGLVKTAALIAQARAEQPLAILVENGDLIQGSALADYVVADFPIAAKTHPIIQALNQLKYDVANLGNHEFNFGLDYLAATYRDASFPVLASNLELTSETAATLKQEWVSIAWLERQVKLPQTAQPIPLKIAVIGVAPPQIMQWDQHHLKGKATVLPMVSTTQSKVTEAREKGADVIILAAHTGMPKHTNEPQDNEQTGWLLAGIDGIDAMLLGHQHEVFPGSNVYDQLPDVDSSAGVVRGVATVQPGIYGSHLGIIDLELDYSEKTGWRVVAATSSARAVTAATKVDERLAAHLQSVHKATLSFMQQPIGATAHPLSYKTARWQPSSAVQFVQRAQLWQAQQLIAANQLEQLPILSAAAPFDAAFSATEAATMIPAGPLTRGAIGDLYRYPNTLDIVKLNGAQVKDWLEQSATAFIQASAKDTNRDCWQSLNEGFPHYNFDTLLGLEYTIYSTAPAGQRIKELRFAGQEVTAKQLFYVATNNYRANGGGDFPHLDGTNTVIRGADMLADVLLKYIGNLPQGQYTEELENHWQVIGCGGRI
ncbi:bifunctional 2',3'-cyclic-nucleotide 2'-phosphodiesterase/3'-nucleotidase [Pseudidiomarina sp.]|uniref:bifunctional 2',3'-cyclic-nucleotide 2'-phosphodiesterase/3'-nucleotidase n=1 Tax=Pseudidiomarina sp. TaxID=2081707 RepID=UPI003A97E859